LKEILFFLSKSIQGTFLLSKNNSRKLRMSLICIYLIGSLIGEGSNFNFVLVDLTELLQILRTYYDHPGQLSFMNVYAKRSVVPGAVIIDGMISSSSQQIV
jgi:hypothetical protein